MITMADIRNHSIKTSAYEDLRVWVLPPASCKVYQQLGSLGTRRRVGRPQSKPEPLIWLWP